MQWYYKVTYHLYIYVFFIITGKKVLRPIKSDIITMHIHAFVGESIFIPRNIGWDHLWLQCAFPLYPKPIWKGSIRWHDRYSANYTQRQSPFTYIYIYLYMQILWSFAAPWISAFGDKSQKCQLLCECALTTGTNSDTCVLTLTDRSPLSMHTCLHSASSLQPPGKSVILAFEKRRSHCATAIETIYRRGPIHKNNDIKIV